MAGNRTFLLSLAIAAACGGSDALNSPGDLASVDAARATDGPPTGGGGTWYNTCGDPVCGGHRDHPGVAACTTQRSGGACAPLGAMCDPMSQCNQLLTCATTDPTAHVGGCPISRRRFKEDIRYLDDGARERYYRELLTLPLPTRDQVDLYGYTSMAVAALQVQARRIEALQREIARLGQRRAPWKQRAR